MSTSDVLLAYEVMESLDLTQQQIACFEIMLREDAEAHHKAGDGVKGGELSRRANYLSGMRVRARISTYGDTQRDSEVAALVRKPDSMTATQARAKLLALKRRGFPHRPGR